MCYLLQGPPLVCKEFHPSIQRRRITSELTWRGDYIQLSNQTIKLKNTPPRSGPTIWAYVEARNQLLTATNLTKPEPRSITMPRRHSQTKRQRATVTTLKSKLSASCRSG